MRAFTPEVGHTHRHCIEKIFFYPSNTDWLLGSLIQSLFHLHTLLYSAPMSSFLPPPNMESLPSYSFELLQLPEDRQTGEQALGDGVMVVLMGDGGEGAKNSVARMSTNTHVYIDMNIHTGTHTNSHTHNCCQSFPSSPPLRPLCGLIGVIIFA